MRNSGGGFAVSSRLGNQHFLAFPRDLFYHSLGWFGVVIMMTIESACIPLPSEIIMPLAGQYLVNIRQHSRHLAAGFFGALGCTIGSIIAYWVGALGGRPIVEKYGKYILINKHHLDTGDRWFEKYGEWAVFFGASCLWSAPLFPSPRAWLV